MGALGTVCWLLYAVELGIENLVLESISPPPPPLPSPPSPTPTPDLPAIPHRMEKDQPHPSTEYWVLDTWYLILDTGCWLIDTGYWLLGTGYWIL